MNDNSIIDKEVAGYTHVTLSCDDCDYTAKAYVSKAVKVNDKYITSCEGWECWNEQHTVLAVHN